MRPHIVFFGEIPLEMRRIEREITESTLMIVIGHIGQRLSAAGLRSSGTAERSENGLRRPGGSA